MEIRNGAVFPVNDEENNVRYQRYKALVDKEENVTFGRRLVEYKYYEMAPIIKNVMRLFEKG